MLTTDTHPMRDRIVYLFLMWTLLSLLSLHAPLAQAAADLTLEDPETLTEWQVEGHITMKLNGQKDKAWFSWTQLGTDYTLTLRERSIVGSPISTTRGSLGGTPITERDTRAFGAQGDALIAALGQHQLYDALVFWLRGLQASDSAQIDKHKPSEFLRMTEQGWELEFDDYLTFNNYPLPREIALKSDEGKINIEVWRAETGFLTHWCSDYYPDNTDTTKSDVKESQGSATEDTAHTPQHDGTKATHNQPDAGRHGTIDTDAFCAQLAKLHGGVIHPKHGIFGPDSMMWRINKYIAPAGLGAGRALLLQISHPWVTAGIDDHSDVRNDPLERARRTYIYMYSMIYGSLPQAMNAANDVHQIHKQITGQLEYEVGDYAAQSEYRANHIEAMIWVNATLWDTLIKMYEQVEHPLTDQEKERFYQETKVFGMLFGIPPEAMPDTWEDFQQYCRDMWNSDQLAITPASVDLANEMFRKRNLVFFMLMPLQKYITAHNLPPRFQEGYDLKPGFFGKMMYKPIMLAGKIADRLLIPPLRHNVMYQEAQARVHGKKPGWVARTALKWFAKQPTLVN